VNENWLVTIERHDDIAGSAETRTFLLCDALIDEVVAFARSEMKAETVDMDRGRVCVATYRLVSIVATEMEIGRKP
jgi:hypothetical protein